MTTGTRRPVEWPTLALLALCYLVWGLSTTLIAAAAPGIAIALTAVAIALHGSLTHEVIHGHPFESPRANAALVWPTLSLVIPYGRFRDLHLAHHTDSVLTDPYDDPESNYLDPERWTRLSAVARMLLGANNTLAGRLILGPLLSQVAFMADDARLLRAGDRAVRSAWLWHIPQAGLVIAWLVTLGQMPLWAYALAVYGGLALLKIRTFLEHQAHEKSRARTVIIEDRGPLAWLFLNNNLHVVHHMHPRVPWYRLPRLYADNPDRYLRRNEGYRYRSYAEIFARHFLRAKDPVPHPLWRGSGRV
jgi:fatty acid desaturase